MTLFLGFYYCDIFYQRFDVSRSTLHFTSRYRYNNQGTKGLGDWVMTFIESEGDDYTTGD